CHQVFGKARTAITDARIQKSRPNPVVTADSLTNLVDICAYRFADRGHRVDERNLHGQKRVGSVLDEFRTLGASNDERRRDGRRWWARNRTGPLVITATCQRSVYLAQDRG